MATSFPSKHFTSPIRPRVASSVCAIALAATGLVGLGLRTDAGSSHVSTPMWRQVAPGGLEMAGEASDLQPTPISSPRRQTPRYSRPQERTGSSSRL
jgi:hypothetical protein